MDLILIAINWEKCYHKRGYLHATVQTLKVCVLIPDADPAQRYGVGRLQLIGGPKPAFPDLTVPAGRKE